MRTLHLVTPCHGRPVLRDRDSSGIMVRRPILPAWLPPGATIATDPCPGGYPLGTDEHSRLTPDRPREVD
jgi:hypothetical protein